MQCTLLKELAMCRRADRQTSGQKSDNCVYVHTVNSIFFLEGLLI